MRYPHDYAYDDAKPKQIVQASVLFGKLPTAVGDSPRREQFATWLTSKDNPLFAKVVESQKAWAKRVMFWHNEVQVDQRVAYAHYFGKGPAA